MVAMKLYTLIAASLLAGSAHAQPFWRYLLEAGSTTPELPQSSLPAPDPSWSLKYIALGLGTQNYSCATSDSTSTPAATGAAASLYDLTPAMKSAVLSKQAETQSTCYADRLNSNFMLKQLGVHYFTSAGVPTFDLTKGTPEDYYLSAKKLASAPAPSGACSGRDSSAAVAWLQLADNGSGATKGLKGVYRVETTGGSAPSSCAGKPALFTQDYAAEYWFYG